MLLLLMKLTNLLTSQGYLKYRLKIMNNTILKMILFIVLMVSPVLGGCCDSKNNIKEKAEANKAVVDDISKEIIPINKSANGGTDYDELRRKVNVAEAASVVGYDGKAIKKDLQAIGKVYRYRPYWREATMGEMSRSD